jgi:hypothetical protein
MSTNNMPSGPYNLVNTKKGVRFANHNNVRALNIGSKYSNTTQPSQKLIQDINNHIAGLEINDVDDLFVKFNYNNNILLNIAIKKIIEKKTTDININIDYDYIKKKIDKDILLKLKLKIISCVIFYTYFAHLEVIAKNDLKNLTKKIIKNEKKHMYVDNEKINNIIELYEKEFNIKNLKNNNVVIKSIILLIIKFFNN